MLSPDIFLQVLFAYSLAIYTFCRWIFCILVYMLQNYPNRCRVLPYLSAALVIDILDSMAAYITVVLFEID